MPEALREWRIHIGAHKTATTHLQDQLARSRDRLAEAGVDALPTPLVRPAGPARCVRLGLARGSLGGTLAEAVAGLRRGPGRVVLSDEEWLGHIGDAVSARPYGNLWWRLRVLSAATAGAPLRLHLAIRPFDRQIPSAYAEALRHRPPRRRPGDLLPALLRRPPRWRRIIERVRRAAPRAELTVWEHATYAADWRAVYRRLTGVEPSGLADAPPPDRTRTPPAAAVAAAERLDPRMPRADWVARVDALFAEDGARPYRPWPAEVARPLREAYRADLDWLSAHSDGPFHRFPPLRPD